MKLKTIRRNLKNVLLEEVSRVFLFTRNAGGNGLDPADLFIQSLLISPSLLPLCISYVIQSYLILLFALGI